MLQELVENCASLVREHVAQRRGLEKAACTWAILSSEACSLSELQPEKWAYGMHFFFILELTPGDS